MTSHLATMNRPPHARHLSRLSVAPQMATVPPLYTPGPQSAIYSGFPNTQLPPHMSMHHPSQSMHFIGNNPGAFIHPGMPGMIPPMSAQGQSFPPFGQLPQTPVGHPPPHFNAIQPGNPPFNQRQRRQQSISIGLSTSGPPKAALGGPQRNKLSPLPKVAALAAPSPSSPAVTPQEAPKPPSKKKMTVRLPVETIRDEDLNVSDGETEQRNPQGSSSGRPAPFARNPVPIGGLLSQPSTVLPELQSVEIFPSPRHEGELPPTIEVFLPPQSSWNTYKSNLMELKLAKLGVQPANGAQGQLPFIPGHSTRSASVSSPADPALLFARLNQLQHSQGSSPLSGPHNLSPHTSLINPSTPGSTGSNNLHLQQPPRFVGTRHSHSMSMAALSSSTFSPLSLASSQHSAFGFGSSNPFGHHALLGGDGMAGSVSNASRSPNVPHSLPSVSEAVSEEEDGGAEAANPAKDETSPSPPVDGTTPPPVPALSPSDVSAKDAVESTVNLATPAAGNLLTRAELMRGFGIEDEEDEDVADDVEEDYEESPIELEQHERDAAGSLAQKKYNEQLEGELADPAEDADEEDVEYDEEPEEDEAEVEDDNFTTPSHSRHISKASLAPSLAEVGAVRRPGAGRDGAERVQEVDEEHLEQLSGMDDAALQEWTGSEGEIRDHIANGVRGDHEDSESGSLGEFSNPSDEERALQEKLHRRQLRALRKQRELFQQHQHRLSQQSQDTTPRRLPPFPHPPSNEYTHFQASASVNSEDIISNPSEEEDRDMRFNGIDGDTYFAGGGRKIEAQDYNSPFNAAVQRPLPPLPHSRQASGQPTYSHSPSQSRVHHSPAASAGAMAQKDASLNPFAKPFVFGGRPGSGTLTLGSPAAHASPATSGGNSAYAESPRGPIPSLSSHNRHLSLASRLNAAAMEFKPTGSFTFQPPPGVPSLSFAEPPSVAASAEPWRPLPNLPGDTSTARAVQGREKRLKLESDDEDVSSPVDTAETRHGGLGSGSNFQFPRPMSPSRRAGENEDTTMSTPKTVLEDEEELPIVPEAARRGSVLNVNAKPFAFSGFTFGGLSSSVSAPPYQPSLFSIPTPTLEMPQPVMYPHPIPHLHQSVSEQPSPTHIPSTPGDYENALPKALSMPADSPQARETSPELYEDGVPSSSTRFTKLGVKRMPIPDFQTHPVSTNTVPASLFKALANPEQAPLTESPNAPTRTRMSVRSRLSSREIFEHASRPSLDDLHVPSISRKITSKPPSAPVTRIPEPYFSQVLPIPPPVATVALAPPPRPRDRRSSFPSRTGEDAQDAPPIASPAAMSESMFSRPPQNKQQGSGIQPYESVLEHVLDTKMEQIRQELVSLVSSRTKGSENATNAAITQAITSLRSQIAELAGKLHNNVANGTAQPSDAHGEFDFELLRDIIDQSAAELRASTQQGLSSVLGRIDSIPVASEHNKEEVLNSIEDLQAFMAQNMNDSTDKLLSCITAIDSAIRHRPLDERQQLLHDLTSFLLPHIKAARSEPIDIDRITLQLAEAVKPSLHQLIDLASDKQETAGLIVKHLRPVLQSLVPPQLDLRAIADQLAIELDRVHPPTDPHALKEEVADLVVERLASRLALRDAAFNPDNIASRVADAIVTPLEYLNTLPSAESIQSLNAAQATLQAQNVSLITQQEELASRLTSLPESLVAATESLASARAELIAKTKSLAELDDVQRLTSTNADLQSQLNKARSAHGQARSEKDVLAQRLQAAETEREKLRAELDSLKAQAVNREQEMAIVVTKSSSLESALSQALDRLKSSDVASQTQQDRIQVLERSNRDLVQETHQHQTKIAGLELQAKFATRDLDVANHTRKQLEVERDSLKAQQHHWDDLRRTAEQVETLARLIGETESEEIRELKRIRDRSRDIEAQHTTLHKRFIDQEAKLSSVQRSAASSKEALEKAQTQSATWEKRANDLDDELKQLDLELLGTRDARDQLQVEVSDLKSELQNKATQEQRALEREQGLRNQVVTLESQLLSVKTELQEATQVTKTPIMQHPQPAQPTGRFWKSDADGSSARPPSQASTVAYTDIGTPKVNGNDRELDNETPSPPPKGLWDSMHAPKRYIPHAATSRVSSYSYRRDIPSPSPSTVSVAPTEQEGGWWA